MRLYLVVSEVQVEQYQDEYDFGHLSIVAINVIKR